MKAAVLSCLAAAVSAAKTTKHYPYTGPCADRNIAASSNFGMYCPDVASTGNCNEFGGMTKLLCPVSCGICEHNGDGTFEGGVDHDDMAALAYGGASCADIKASCGVTPFLNGICGASCKHNCEGLGFDSPGTEAFEYDAGYSDSETCVGVPYGECHDMNYGEAEDLCESWGARLCSVDQLTGGMADAALASRFGAEMKQRWASYYDYADFPVMNYGDNTCHGGQFTWLHPQGIGNCKIGGSNVGHSVAPISNGFDNFVNDPDFQSNSCRAHNAKAKPLCCYSEKAIPFNDLGRKMLEEAPAKEIEFSAEFAAKLAAFREANKAKTE